MGSPPPDGIACDTTADCPSSGACAENPVCWTHESPHGKHYCAEQVTPGNFGTSADACAQADQRPFIQCYEGKLQRYCQTSRGTLQAPSCVLWAFGLLRSDSLRLCWNLLVLIFRSDVDAKWLPSSPRRTTKTQLHHVSVTAVNRTYSVYPETGNPTLHGATSMLSD